MRSFPDHCQAVERQYESSCRRPPPVLIEKQPQILLGDPHGASKLMGAKKSLVDPATDRPGRDRKPLGDLVYSKAC